MLGIGCVGNIVFNELGLCLNFIIWLILLDSGLCNEVFKIFGIIDNIFISFIMMGVVIIFVVKKIYLLVWGEEKVYMVKECVEGNVIDIILVFYL